MENPFTNLYADYTNEQLVAVISNPSDYEPLAVEAATMELQKRNVSTEEIERIKLELKQKKEAERDVQRDIKKLSDKLASKATVLENGAVSNNRVINRLCIILGLFFLYTVYKEWFLILFFFDDISEWDSSTLHFFTLFLLPAIAAYTFYKRKTVGWVLLAIHTTVILFSSAVNIYLYYTIPESNGGGLDDLFQMLMPRPNLPAALINGAIWGIVLAFICKKNIRTIYKITGSTAGMIIGITAAVLLFFYWV